MVASLLAAPPCAGLFGSGIADELCTGEGMWEEDAEGLSLVQLGSRSSPQSSHASSQFRVETLTLGDPGKTVGMKVLRNLATGESADIAYTFGGKVDALRLLSPVTGEVRDVLLSSGRNATKLLTMGWAVNQFLVPYANRIAGGTYEMNGTTYRLPRTDSGSNFTNAIHGLLGDHAMQVVAESADEHGASVTLAYDLSDKAEGYPFPVSVRFTHTLDSHGLTISVSAKNYAETGGPAPFYFGMHPYFLVSDVSKSSIVLDSCSAWNLIETDDLLIPTGITVPFHKFGGEPIGGSTEKPTHWDDGFKATAGSAKCSLLNTELYDPGFGDSSILWMKSPEIKWLQIFTGGTPGLGQVVALEPMSGETDAFNNHQAEMLLLQAGESWEGKYGFQLARPSAKP